MDLHSKSTSGADAQEGNHTHTPPVHIFNPKASIFTPMSGASDYTPAPDSAALTDQSENTLDDSSDKDGDGSGGGADQGEGEDSLPLEGTRTPRQYGYGGESGPTIHDSKMSLYPDPHPDVPLTNIEDTANVATNPNSHNKNSQSKPQGNPQKRSQKSPQTQQRFFPAELFGQNRASGVLGVDEAAALTSPGRGNTRTQSASRRCPLCSTICESESYLKEHLNSSAHTKDAVREGQRGTKKKTRKAPQVTQGASVPRFPGPWCRGPEGFWQPGEFSQPRDFWGPADFSQRRIFWKPRGFSPFGDPWQFGRF